jgi:hypothetical protein
MFEKRWTLSAVMHSVADSGTVRVHMIARRLQQSSLLPLATKGEHVRNLGR